MQKINEKVNLGKNQSPEGVCCYIIFNNVPLRNSNSFCS